MLKPLARKALHLADAACALLAPRRGGGSLVTLLFHSVCTRAGELDDPRLAPCQPITVEDFKRLLGMVLDAGYAPVSPAEVDQGLRPGRNHVLVTFDDGYFNNAAVLPVLESFQAPATFFISSDNVEEGKGYWWDVFHREMAARCVDPRQRTAEIERVKGWPPEEIEAFLRRQFGPAALRPTSDLDRPFTPAELRDLAASRWVHLGNHTRSHAILPHRTLEEVRSQIEGCQRAIEAMAGVTPIAIAYPNGDYCEETVNAVIGAGLRLGFTVRPHASRLPLQGAKQRMTIGRFSPTSAADLALQWRKFDSGFVPSFALKTLLTSGY